MGCLTNLQHPVWKLKSWAGHPPITGLALRQGCLRAIPGHMWDPSGSNPFNPPWGQLNQRNQEARPPKLMFLFGYVPSLLAQNQRRDILAWSILSPLPLPHKSRRLDFRTAGHSCQSLPTQFCWNMMSAQAMDQTGTYQKMDQTWSNQKDQKVIVSN